MWNQWSNARGWQSVGPIPVYTEKILTYLSRENINKGFDNQTIDMNNVTERIAANFI